MYLEERIQELQNKVTRLEEIVSDLITRKSTDKPILRLYTIELPIEWESFTELEVRVSIDGVTLKEKIDYTTSHQEELLSGYYGLDWINALLIISNELGLNAYYLRAYAMSLAENHKTEDLEKIKNLVQQEYHFVYDDYLEVDVEDFSIMY